MDPGSRPIPINKLYGWVLDWCQDLWASRQVSDHLPQTLDQACSPIDPRTRLPRGTCQSPVLEYLPRLIGEERLEWEDTNARPQGLQRIKRTVPPKK